MKKYLYLLFITISSVLSYPTSALGKPLPEPQQPTSPNWIEVGSVYGESYGNPNDGYYVNGSKELKLYVMHLGDKLIYRVERNGAFYSVNYYHSESNPTQYNATAVIPDWEYKMVRRKDGTDYKKNKICYSLL